MSDVTPADEEFDTMMEVERNPCGAWQAIQAQAAELERLRAVASGDLIPRADAEQAVAVAYGNIAREVGRWALAAEEEILALAPAEALAEVERMRAALESIARNTCCDGCQEAALVARAALSAYEGGKE